MRRLAIARVAACGGAPAPIANTGAPPEHVWPDRVRALCAPIGTDAAHGLGAVTLEGVTFGDEIVDHAGYSGGAQQRWKIASPAPYHVIGIASRRASIDTPTGFRLADTSEITAVWLETGTDPNEICRALELPIANHSCKRTEGDRLVLVSIEDRDSRVVCGRVVKRRVE